MPAAPTAATARGSAAPTTCTLTWRMVRDHRTTFAVRPRPPQEAPRCSLRFALRTLPCLQSERLAAHSDGAVTACNAALLHEYLVPAKAAVPSQVIVPTFRSVRALSPVCQLQHETGAARTHLRGQAGLPVTTRRHPHVFRTQLLIESRAQHLRRSDWRWPGV